MKKLSIVATLLAVVFALSGCDSPSSTASNGGPPKFAPKPKDMVAPKTGGNEATEESGAGETGKSGGESDDAAEPTEPVAKKKPVIGEEAPEIAGVDLDGTEFKLSDYRGKVVMLDFWGDW